MALPLITYKRVDFGFSGGDKASKMDINASIGREAANEQRGLQEIADENYGKFLSRIRALDADRLQSMMKAYIYMGPANDFINEFPSEEEINGILAYIDQHDKYKDVAVQTTDIEYAKVHLWRATNEYLIHGTTNAAMTYITNHTKRLDSLFAGVQRTSKYIPVLRYDDHVSGSKVGDVIHYPQFVSTTFEYEQIEPYVSDQSTMMVIFLPKGKKVLYTNSELQIILPRDTRMVVKHIDMVQFGAYGSTFRTLYCRVL